MLTNIFNYQQQSINRRKQAYNNIFSTYNLGTFDGSILTPNTNLQPLLQLIDLKLLFPSISDQFLKKNRFKIAENENDYQLHKNGKVVELEKMKVVIEVEMKVDFEIYGNPQPPNLWNDFSLSRFSNHFLIIGGEMSKS